MKSPTADLLRFPGLRLRICGRISQSQSGDKVTHRTLPRTKSGLGSSTSRALQVCGR